MRVSHSRWSKAGRWYSTGTVKTHKSKEVEVQVTESPTGRSVQVHLLADGYWRKVYP